MDNLSNNASANTKPQYHHQNNLQPVHRPSRRSRMRSLLATITIIIVAILLIAGSVLWLGAFRYKDSLAKKVNTNQYQAIFLDSGQVYFGKLSSDKQFYVLKDIYYLQQDTTVQPDKSKAAQQPNVSLVKLGNELHGPEDTMYIEHAKVSFWENLKSDGKVSQAIKNPPKQQ